MAVRLATPSERREILLAVANQLESDVLDSADAPKVRMLVDTVRELATGVAPSS
jgi:hypothetical protein